MSRAFTVAASRQFDTTHTGIRCTRSRRDHEQDGLLVIATRLLTKLLTIRFDLDRSSRCSGGRSLRSARLPFAVGSWLTRWGSTGPTPLPPLIGSRLAACPRALR